MCKKNLPTLFTIMSSFMLISLLGLALINMISSIMAIHDFDTFEELYFPDDYKNIYTYNFLMDLNFGSELEFKNDYDIIGEIKTLCYNGICNLESSNKITLNCSQACLTSTEYCYDGKKRCNTKICEEDASKRGSFSACQEFNRIKYWKNTEFFRYTEVYKATPYVDIVPKDKDCRYGYKKCGIVNEKKDYLCLSMDKEFECPINDIIVKSNNEFIEEGYRSFKLGDKYLFVSHDKTDNYIIKNLSITLNIDDKDNTSDLIKLDKESFQDLTKYNNISLDGTDQPAFAFLNAVPFKFNYTYEEMMKLQELIDKGKKIFSEQTIYKLNLEVSQYEDLLLAFGIIIFCIVGLYTIFIYPIYCFDCSTNASCRDCCFLCSTEFSPLRHVCRSYVIGIPIIILLLFSWIVIFIEKVSINNLNYIEFIEEYKKISKKEIFKKKYTNYWGDYQCCSYENLEITIKHNNVQFVVLLISLILVILYPIIIILLYRHDKEKKETIYYNEGLCLQPVNDTEYIPS